MWIQKVPGGGVEGLAYAPDGRTLYTADRGGWVSAWDPLTHTGTRLFRLPRGRTEPVSLSVLAGGLLLTRGANWVVWDTSGRERARVPSDLLGFARVLLLRGTRLYLRSDHLNSINTWELLRGEPGPTLSGWDILGTLRTFDLSPEGRTAVLTDTHGYVTLFDLHEHREVDRFEPSFSGWELTDARFSGDGSLLLLSAGPRVRFWDLASRSVRGELVLGVYYHFSRECHPTESIFAGLNREGQFTLYSLATGGPLRSLDFALGQQVLCSCFSPDGLTCAVGGSNRQFAVFDVDV